MRRGLLLLLGALAVLGSVDTAGAQGIKLVVTPDNVELYGGQSAMVSLVVVAYGGYVGQVTVRNVTPPISNGEALEAWLKGTYDVSATFATPASGNVDGANPLVVLVEVKVGLKHNASQFPQTSFTFVAEDNSGNTSNQATLTVIAEAPAGVALPISYIALYVLVALVLLGILSLMR